MNAQSHQLEVSPSPLQLDGYFVKNLSFALSSDFKEDDAPTVILGAGLHPQLEEPFKTPSVSFELEFAVSKNIEDDSKYKFTLKITSSKEKEKNLPYTFDVELVAYFSWMPEDKSFPDLEVGIQTSAINIMYSLVREVLASATSRSLYPAIVLPTSRFSFKVNETKSIPEKATSEKKQLLRKVKKNTTKRAKKS